MVTTILTNRLLGFAKHHQVDMKGWESSYGFLENNYLLTMPARPSIRLQLSPASYCAPSSEQSQDARAVMSEATNAYMHMNFDEGEFIQQQSGYDRKEGFRRYTYRKSGFSVLIGMNVLI